jgi:hypothetical protein
LQVPPGTLFVIQTVEHSRANGAAQVNKKACESQTTRFQFGCMDSWAEKEWLKRFRKRIEGHIALMMTHRFTTAMHADMIHVMDGGRIIESGTHDRLVAANRPYAESWCAQVQDMAII